MQEETKLSRRQVINGLGASLAVAAVSPIVPAEAAGNAATAAPEPLRDPTTAYPKPPFKSQTQPWPGLASKMEPVPDHGEKSYKGSGRLKGRKASLQVATPAWAAPPPLPTPAKVPM